MGLVDLVTNSLSKANYIIFQRHYNKVGIGNKSEVTINIVSLMVLLTASLVSLTRTTTFYNELSGFFKSRS